MNTAIAPTSSRAAADSGFVHPADGWYQIESSGEHQNARAGVIQVIDNDAVNSIVNNFNREASQPNFAGMLIDIDHLKHDESHDTRAFGWLMRLRNRGGVLEGQIRWTGIGQAAVDNGEFRFFSTEFDQRDLQVLTNSNPKRVRPLRLDGLTLTNSPNNKGARPITNRTILNRRLTDPYTMNTTLETTENVDQSNPGLARHLADQMAASTGRPFEHCWNSVRNSHPHLFGLPSREETQACEQQEASARAERINVRNRAASAFTVASIGRNHKSIVNRQPASTFEIGDKVREFQRANGFKTFSEAWSRAQRAHPDWFYEEV